MLQFVLGRAGSGKTEYLRRLLADRSRAGLGGVMMLVPEQYTFETEKAMLRLAGPVRGNAIPVYSFTRLAEAVFRREGGAAGRRLSDGGRRILMASAIEACQDRLEVYASAAKGGRVNDVMLTAVNEMKMCGISPGDLLETARTLGDPGPGQKAAGAFPAVRYIRRAGGRLLSGLPGRPDPAGPGFGDQRFFPGIHRGGGLL